MTVSGETQNSMIAPSEAEEDPRLCRDQAIMHALLGTLIDVFDEVAMEESSDTK